MVMMSVNHVHSPLTTDTSLEQVHTDKMRGIHDRGKVKCTAGLGSHPAIYTSLAEPRILQRHKSKGLPRRWPRDAPYGRQTHTE